MENFSRLILLGGAVFFTLLIMFKTYGFYKSTNRPTLKRWLFYSHVDIETSGDDSKRKLKRRQNTLSLLILICVVIFFLAYFLYRSLRGSFIGTI